ncbi:MAG: oxidoreductase [Cyclobacteriaceae bacterium]|nr:oxidoreductase [Cyclobacteriaceae bacterium]
MATALIAGSTGLVGSQLLNLLLEEPSYDKVIALVRKPLGIQHPKLVNKVVNFDSLADAGRDLQADDVFCCLGTTIKQAGSQAAFRKVDYEYPLSLARQTHALGAKQFLIITAMGSSKSSSIFYNRVKGEVEEAISSVGFETIHILQPSLLLGDRKDDRSGESTGKVVMKVLDFAIPKKYKAIESVKVAKAMLALARQKQKGTHVHHSGELQNY